MSAGSAVSAVAIPQRLLLGSGPSPVPERVLRALAQPTIGHLDPVFGELMDETAALLRETFQTANPATLPLSATGSGGMDALVVNFVDPGERVVCGVNGLFGERMAEALARAGAHVARVEAPWGRAIDPQQLIEALQDGGASAMFVVHGETSTGVCQPLAGLPAACHEYDALLPEVSQPPPAKGWALSQHAAVEPRCAWRSACKRRCPHRCWRASTPCRCACRRNAPSHKAFQE